jgi:hypothetical protein
MTPYEERKRRDFRFFRTEVLRVTQLKMAAWMGYAHKIRVSELERETNPVPVPEHIYKDIVQVFLDWFVDDKPIPATRRRLARKWGYKA